jgi:hypothetical protein
MTSSSSDGRKKTSSVSFSVEDNENAGAAEKGTGEVKKNKASTLIEITYNTEDLLTLIL